MKKIEIPICSKTLIHCMVASYFGILIIAILAMQIKLFLNGDAGSIIFALVLFLPDFLFIFQMLDSIGKSHWLKYLNPFKLKRDCNR